MNNKLLRKNRINHFGIISQAMPRQKNSIYLVIKKGVFLGLFPFVLLVQCIWAPQSSSFYSQANVPTTVLLQKENGKTISSKTYDTSGYCNTVERFPGFSVTCSKVRKGNHDVRYGSPR